MDKTKIITHIDKRGRFVNLFEQELWDINDFKPSKTKEEEPYSWYKNLCSAWNLYEDDEREIDFKEMNQIAYETTKKYFINKTKS